MGLYEQIEDDFSRDEALVWAGQRFRPTQRDMALLVAQAI
jgi:hypothetical protein